MAWERITWQDYGLHTVKGNPSESDIVKSTLHEGRAKYRPGLPIEKIELSVFTDMGRLIKETRGVRVFYLIEREFDFVGWDEGERTDIVRVEWGASPPGPVHGHPYSERNLIRELRSLKKKSEIQFLNEFRRQQRLPGDSMMSFINWDQILPRWWNAEVIFSYLEIDADDSAVNYNPVGIRMPGDLLLNVDFDTRRHFTVSLVRSGSLSPPIRAKKCHSVSEVIAAVKSLGLTARSIYLSSTNDMPRFSFSTCEEIETTRSCNVRSESNVVVTRINTVRIKSSQNSVVRLEAGC